MAIVNSIQRVMAGFGAGSGGPGAVVGGYVAASAVTLNSGSLDCHCCYHGHSRLFQR